MSKIIFIHKKNNKQEYNKYSERILRAGPKTLCIDKVNREFLQESIKTADYLFINETRGEIRGFATVYHDNFDGKHIHISLICNSTTSKVITRKGVPTLGGKALIDAILAYGKQIKVKDVRLDAIKEVIPYYYKLGFTFENSHYNKDKEAELIKELRKAYLNKSNTEFKQILRKIVVKFYSGYFKEKFQHDMGKDDDERVVYAMDRGIPMKFVFKPQSICKGKSIKQPNKCAKHKTCKVVKGRKRSYCRKTKNTRKKYNI